LLGLLLHIAVFWKGWFVFAPVLGWWLATVGLAVQHDANHGALFARPWLNALCGLGDDLIGGSSLIWRHHHVVGHHVFTNDAEQDPDAFAGVPFLRLHPSNPQKWYHKYQHIYFGFLTGIMYYSYPVVETSVFLARKFGDIEFHPLSLQDKIEFWGGKVINILFYTVLPFYFYGLSYLLPYLLMMGIGGGYLALVFIVSHNTVEIEQDYVPQKGKGDWAEQQIRQSSNWGTENWIANFCTGGLNTQIEHHLFPCVSHRHYPALSLIVRKKCAEKGIPYVTYPTLYDNCYSLLSHLKRLGNAPMKTD
jgi:linoleoyl-CoA desaturase